MEEIFDSNIKYKKDIIPILQLIDNLTPWDKNGLIAYLWNNLDGESIKKLAEEFGFVNYDNLDIVQEVINNNQETEVLDEMQTYEIIDYLFNGWGTGWSSLDKSDAIDILSRFNGEEIAEYINKKDIPDFLDNFYKNNKETFNNWLINRIEKGEE